MEQMLFFSELKFLVFKVTLVLVKGTFQLYNRKVLTWTWDLRATKSFPKVPRGAGWIPFEIESLFYSSIKLTNSDLKDSTLLEKQYEMLK